MLIRLKKILFAAAILCSIQGSLYAQEWANLSTAEPVSVWGVIAGAVAPVVDASGDLFGNVRRSCSAGYRLTLLDSPGPGNKVFSTGMFTSTGGCGSTVPDRCRRRARDRAHACMLEHWSNASLSDMPETCSGEDTSMVGYGITELDSFLQKTICRVKGPGNYKIRVEAVTNGNSGCSKAQVLAPLQTVECL